MVGKRNGHKDHGKIFSEIQRTPADVLKRLAEHGVARISDVMAGGGLMNPALSPLEPGTKIAGCAITVWVKPGDGLFLLPALDLAQPNDVLVVNAGGLTDYSLFGDGVGSVMKARGVAGLVLDGAVRDADGLRALGFPVYCRGVTALGGSTTGPGAVNIPIACGSVVVSPGDVVVGDDDGIVVVPHEDVQRVLTIADQRRDNGQKGMARLHAGNSYVEEFGAGARLEEWAQQQ